VQECPQLIFHALRADFTALPGPPELPASNPWLIAFIGSTLGNLPRPVHAPYLRELRSIMRPADFLLTGADLVKDTQETIAAHDDSGGVTSACKMESPVRPQPRTGRRFQARRIRASGSVEWRRTACRNEAVHRPGICTPQPIECGSRVTPETL
jgi:hypothetical protein